MRKLTTLAGALLLWVAVIPAAKATPWYTQDPRTLPEGGWRVETHVLYSEIDNSLVDGDKGPLPGGATDASALVFHNRFRYGLKDDLTVFVDVPYVSKRVHLADGAVRDSSGLGDLNLLAKYKYSEDKKAGERKAVALFYKTHTGDYRGLSGLLATGTGQDNVGLLHLWEWDRADTNWYANLGYVWTGERKDNHKDGGDLVLFNLAAEHSLGKTSPWRLVGELNGQYEGNGKQAGAPVAGSGSTVISVAPGVQYAEKRGKTATTWEAGVQVPVVKRGDLPALQDYQLYLGAYTVF